MAMVVSQLRFLVGYAPTPIRPLRGRETRVLISRSGRVFVPPRAGTGIYKTRFRGSPLGRENDDEVVAEHAACQVLRKARSSGACLVGPCGLRARRWVGVA